MTIKITQTFGRGYYNRTTPDPKTENKIKVLIANQAFQKEVAQLRSKWNTPENQNILDTELEKERARVMRIMQHSRLRHRSHRLPTSLSRPPRGSIFYLDILTLMQHFKLRKKLWIKFLWQYVKTGKYQMEDVPSETAPLVHLAQDEETGETRMLIEIGETTTINELKEVWRIAEGLRKRIFPNRKKYKPQKNLERDQRAYELSTQGKTIGEIDKTLQDEYGADLDYGNIKKIVSTYRKKFGLPKGSKLITSRIKVNKRRLLR